MYKSTLFPFRRCLGYVRIYWLGMEEQTDEHRMYAIKLPEEMGQLPGIHKMEKLFCIV